MFSCKATFVSNFPLTQRLCASNSFQSFLFFPTQKRFAPCIQPNPTDEYIATNHTYVYTHHRLLHHPSPTTPIPPACTSFLAVAAMAPPPSASLPLTERLLALAQTLQCKIWRCLPI